MDALAAVFLLIIGVVGFLAGIYSIGYTRHDLETGEFDLNRLTVYYGLFNLFLFTMLLVVTANNIFMMWVAVEATTLGSAFLVGIYQHRSSLEAAWKYIIICTVGVAFGLYGTVLVYSDAVNVKQIPEEAALWTGILKNARALDPTMIKMAFVFILIGFGTKAGLFPMHAWLPDAHSEAPSPISAMLSACAAQLRSAGRHPLCDHHRSGGQHGFYPDPIYDFWYAFGRRGRIFSCLSSEISNACWRIPAWRISADRAGVWDRKPGRNLCWPAARGEPQPG